jgi:hypothetical protein
MRRRDFLIAAGVAGTACLAAPSVGAFAGMQAGATPDPDFHVYLAFGQSNMEGFPGIEARDKEAVDPRFRMLAAVDFAEPGRKKGEWYPAIPPLCRTSTGLCPADYFGRTMVARLPEPISVGVLNVSVAGCKIELFDKDAYQAYLTTVATWMTDIATLYGGNPYQHLVEMGRRAQQKGVIRGILLHQGESNANDKAWPTKVAKVYADLLKDLNLAAARVPLLAGETVNADQQGASSSINTIMAELPTVIPTAHVISSAGCEARRDRLHFTAAGYRELGKRYAEKMLTLL